MVTTIGVTGATGKLGSLVAQRLSAAGADLRLIARSPGKQLPVPDADVRYAEYGDGQLFEAATTGVDTLLLVSAMESELRVAEHTTAIDAALAAGVRRIVYISFQGAAPEATFTFARDHWYTEQHIRQTGVEFTVLRDNNYQLHLPGLADPETGVIRGPAGTGRVAAVAHEDIAEVATAVLLDGTLLPGEVRDVTGPQALTLAEVAGILSRHTGRTITYEPESIPEAYASRAGYGAPEWMVAGWVTSYEAIATGELAAVSDTVQAITGRLPITFDRYLTDHPDILGTLSTS
ncbi:SDR family oxidoreductase [Nocardia sp. NBC_01327]|uniref:SDR family oxidoreductase n=1 Tax=Nocardia sp. NBC_01327 TaxID=2903593 RepID=UPI002E130186|nr:SDR family oxidoreductase [Nocardia sp. NBC_01327]